jgi:hypothetical protein
VVKRRCQQDFLHLGGIAASYLVSSAIKHLTLTTDHRGIKIERIHSHSGADAARNDIDLKRSVVVVRVSTIVRPHFGSFVSVHLTSHLSCQAA